MKRKITSVLLTAKMLAALLIMILASPAQAQINNEGENKPWKRQGPFKNNASEFSFGLVAGIFDVDELNSRLQAAGQPKFSSFDGSLPITYLRTLPGGWALGAEFMVFLDQRQENADVENRINYNNFKILAGKDFLKHENRRLIAYLGGGIGTSVFSSTLQNTENIDFDDMLLPGGPKNTLRTESLLWSMDFRMVYEWFTVKSSSNKYDKWSIIGGYHLPLSNRYRNVLSNSPEFRPAGPYIGWANSIGYHKIKN